MVRIEQTNPPPAFTNVHINAKQSRTFIGTWRSTFTGYITRLRGYYNYPTQFSWYFWDETIRNYKPKSLAAVRSPAVLSVYASL